MPVFASSKVKQIPILMYHSISEYTTPKFRQFVVPPHLFSEHMAYLYQNMYTPITVTQFISARIRNDGILSGKPVIITFDDGFEDFYINALPVLVQYNFVATLYIATGFANGTSSWLEREGEARRPMLTWQQLCEINALGIECGAHSHSHAQLDVLPAIMAKKEIEQSKNIIEDHLGREVTSFAYPYGYQTALLRQLVQDAGCTSACAVKHTMSSENDNPFALARLIVSAGTHINAFGALLTGCNSSPGSAIHNMYARVRTPVWQLTRRSYVLVTHHFCGRW